MFITQIERMLVGVNYRDPAASIILAGRGVVNG
jgi:hypothetical protein